MRQTVTKGAVAAIAVLVFCGCSGGKYATTPLGTRTGDLSGARLPAPGMASLATVWPEGTAGGSARHFGSWISPKLTRTTPLLYVSSPGSGWINIYDQRGNGDRCPLGVLAYSPMIPEGMWVTPNGDLWVANYPYSNVLVFKRGATSPYKTLADVGYNPIGVAVDEHGTVYVANIGDINTGKNGNIAVYYGGHTAPDKYLKVPGGDINVYSDTVDEAGNVYFDYDDLNYVDHLAYFKGGAGSPVDTGAQFAPNPGANPGAVKIDKSGDVVLADGNGPWAGIYELPRKSPVLKFAQNTFTPMGVALNYANTLAWVVDESTGEVSQYAYPGGTFITTIKCGITYNGMTFDATYPGTQP